MGATHTFIIIKTIKKLGITPQLLDVDLNVVSLLGVAVNLCYNQLVGSREGYHQRRRGNKDELDYIQTYL